MQIVWTETAIRHLAGIQAHIQQDKPIAARRVAKVIRETVTYLATHPNLGHAGRKPGTRELVVGDTPYIVPYRVQDGRLTILAILHGARRQRATRDR